MGRSIISDTPSLADSPAGWHDILRSSSLCSFFFPEGVEFLLLCAFCRRLFFVGPLRRIIPARDQRQVSVGHHEWIPQAQLQEPGGEVRVPSAVQAGRSATLHRLVKSVPFAAWTCTPTTLSCCVLDLLFPLSAVCFRFTRPNWGVANLTDWLDGDTNSNFVYVFFFLTYYKVPVK